MKAELSAQVYLPLAEVYDLPALKKELTAKAYAMGETTPALVAGYTLSRAGFIGIPRQFGIDYCDTHGIEIEFKVSYGTPVAFPKKPIPRDYQVAFVDEMKTLAEKEHDFVAQAATGKGKTVMSLIVAEWIGTTTLIVVDQDNLLEQWVKEAKKHLGVTDEDIGIVQGPRCDYEGKKIVIAMMQSLTRKDFEPGLYTWAGLVIFDEVHITGAETFSTALGRFNAVSRFGVSATPKRRDELQTLIEWHLGPVKARLLDQHKASLVYYLESETSYSWYANVSSTVGRIINEITEDDERNLLLAEAIQWLYEKGRDVLVLSDRIEHVENLKALCVMSGVPDKDCGVYTGFHSQYRLSKDNKPARRPHGHMRGSEYCPVKLQAVRSRKNKKLLPPILENSRIIFATFGMFSKGVDAPRLSAGIDCTPRSTAQQTHGRILRTGDGKFVPIWVTVRDLNNHRTEFQFARRVEEYVESNGEIYLWNIKNGVKKQDARTLRREALNRSRELKEATVVQGMDGRNSLVLPAKK